MINENLITCVHYQPFKHSSQSYQNDGVPMFLPYAREEHFL